MKLEIIKKYIFDTKYNTSFGDKGKIYIYCANETPNGSEQVKIVLTRSDAVCLLDDLEKAIEHCTNCQ